MAKTRTAPWDYFNKEARECHVAGQMVDIMEAGRQQFRDQVLSPLMGTLKAIDPDWDAWWEETIPECASLKTIAELVEAHIRSIYRADDEKDLRDTNRSIASTFLPY